MKGMILAAGEGTRLKPLTYTAPKPLVPIVNKPVMEHILNWLSRHGIDTIMINTHYMAEEIERYFGEGSKWNVRIQYSREDKLWGTAGGVRRVKDFFDDTFLVIGGDDLSDVDLNKLVHTHKRTKALATIGLTEVADTRQYGVVVTDASGKIKRFQEKPEPHEALSRNANTGIYIFEPEIFDYIPENEVSDFGRQIFPMLLEKQAGFYGATVEGYWCDIGSVNEYKESHWAILEERCRVKMHGKEIRPGIWAEEPVTIDKTAALKAPCVLGKGTVIEAGAHIGSHVITGRNCRIGKGAKLDHTILWDGAVIGENSELHDCVVSNGVVVK